MERFVSPLILLVNILIVNCHNDGPELLFNQQSENAAPIQTEKNEYVLRYSHNSIEFSINLIFTNSTEKTVYIATCFDVSPPFLERRTRDGQWVFAYAQAAPACLGKPVTIEPDEEFLYTLDVVAGLPSSNIYPKFETNQIPGHYRLVWDIYATWPPDGDISGPGNLLPREQRISNDFRLIE